MLQSHLEFGAQLLAPLRQLLGQPAVEQRLPALASLDPLPRLIQGEPAGPGREWLGRVVSIKFFPKRNGRLLDDVLGIDDVGDEDGDVTKNFAFAPQEKREELLLVSRCFIRRRSRVLL